MFFFLTIANFFHIERDEIFKPGTEMIQTKKKILVVDDSDTMRNLIVFSLSNIPNVAITASNNGLDALKKIQSEQFDIILTDINMPLMDGLKLISMVRGKPEYDKVPIIIITTRGQAEDRERGLRLGANSYLAKPIKTFELQKLVKSYLR